MKGTLLMYTFCRIRNTALLRRFATHAASALLLLLVCCAPANAESVSAKATKYLVLDDRIIDRVEGAELVLGKVEKSPSNPLFGEDRPWEPRGDNYYCNVIYDEQEKIYKCWYNPFVFSELDEKTPRDDRKNVKWEVSKERRFGVCYATSKDGIKWDKPNLGLVDYRGSKDNNIIMFDVHGLDIVKDMTEQDVHKRYKMIGAVGGIGPQRVWYSADGLKWSEPEIYEQIGGRSDTRNNVTWIPERKEWMLISRVGFTPRDVGRSASKNFRDWSPIELVLKPESDNPQFHDMPSFRYGDVYLGLIGVFDVEADRQWVELAWSPDSIDWRRILPGTPFIPNGKKGSYDWGCIFADQPILNESEIRIYYSACNGNFFGWRDAFLCLATLKPDHWAGYKSDSKDKATVQTKTLSCNGTKLALTADVEGTIACSVYDKNGKELAQLETVKDDVTNQVVGDLTKFEGKEIQLRFELQDATLYSFAFTNE